MDTDDEIVYRTSKLYQRHKEIIQYIEENRLSVTAGELADKYPNINEILSGLDKKYEYGNEIFTVLAPHCIEDILKEGKQSIWNASMSRKLIFCFCVRQNSRTNRIIH